MNVLAKLALFLVIVLCLFLPVYAASEPISPVFLTGSSVGFGCGVDETFTLTAQAGNLTGTDVLISIGWDRGSFVYNATNSSTLLAHVNNLDVVTRKNHGSWQPLLDGESVTVAVGEVQAFTWNMQIYDPFDYFTDIGVGLFGFLCVGIGCFWGAYQVRRDEWIMNRMVGFAFALTFLIIGCGLIIGWLW